MDLTLYNAPMLTGSVIQTDIEAYLSYCDKRALTIHEIATLDDMVIDVKNTDLYGQFIPSYAQFGRHEYVNVRYYYVTNIERITPTTVRLTLSRDHIHEHFNINHRICGQYVEGHFPLTSGGAYSLPVPDGNVMGIKRNRPILPTGLGEWGASGKFSVVFRAVLTSPGITGKKSVHLIYSKTATIVTADFIRNIALLLSQGDRFVFRANDNETFEYDIEEITNIWLVPEGLTPSPSIAWKDVAYAPDPFGDLRFDYYVGQVGDLNVMVNYVPTFSDVKTLVGNDLINVELPHSHRPHPVTVIGLYSPDSTLSVTLRVGDKCIDMAPSFDLGSNMFNNSSATVSSKISRGIGVLTGTLGTVSGFVTQNPISIAGGAISTISSATSGIGGRTAVAATGADGLQVASNSTTTGADTGYASTHVGGLAVTYMSLDNGDNITDTMHLFGVQTNVAYRDAVGGLVAPDNVTYVRFDNVRVIAGGVPPQYRAQLTDALTRGVHISDISGIPIYTLTWVGDVNEL